MKSIPPSRPIQTDPNRFPWMGASVAVLILIVLMFVATPLIDRAWGLSVALTWQITTLLAWLLCTCLWLACRGGGKRG